MAAENPRQQATRQANERAPDARWDFAGDGSDHSVSAIFEGYRMRSGGFFSGLSEMLEPLRIVFFGLAKIIFWYQILLVGIAWGSPSACNRKIKVLDHGYPGTKIACYIVYKRWR